MQHQQHEENCDEQRNYYPRGSSSSSSMYETPSKPNKRRSRIFSPSTDGNAASSKKRHACCPPSVLLAPRRKHSHTSYVCIEGLLQDRTDLLSPSIFLPEDLEDSMSNRCTRMTPTPPFIRRLQFKPSNNTRHSSSLDTPILGLELSGRE